MYMCPICNNPVLLSDLKCNYCGYLLSTKKLLHYSSMYSTLNPTPISSTKSYTNRFSIASMILGIVSIPLSYYCPIGAIPAIIAVAFGFTARKNIRRSFEYQKGFGMALVGIITGFISIGLVAICGIAYFTLSILAYIVDDIKNDLINDLKNLQ
ncbi:MAG TPA: DUF4190 domain-containing protein [Clostridia bacterium]|nr:DUF4190 domain-containing protein [Clostridia bacterium]